MSGLDSYYGNFQCFLARNKKTPNLSFQHLIKYFDRAMRSGMTTEKGKSALCKAFVQISRITDGFCELMLINKS